MISVLILTLNEECNIQACIDSLRWSDDIVVLDSYSQDRTEEIAVSLGARVIKRKFDNWSSHQNWAMENIQFKHKWVYYSDADEICEPELRDEMLRVVEASGPEVAFRVRFKNYFLGKWIRRSSLYPTWVMRLFMPEKVRWNRVVNPVAVVSGREGRLSGHFRHYSFNKGMEAWFAKHNSYSSQEAVEAIDALNYPAPSLWSLLTKDGVARRRTLKTLAWRLPFRPFLRFCYMYFLRGGILDGSAGLLYCRLIAAYELMIDAKVREYIAGRPPRA